MSARIIGLTGGIGSGKSTAAAFLKQRGVPVLDADAYARAALDPGTKGFFETVALFGPDVVREDGTLDRKAIADRVFSDGTLRQMLNAIVHPIVADGMQRDTADLDAPLVVWEVPLLFESGFDAYCDRTVAVCAEESIRIERIVQRDGCTAEQAKARIRAQITDEERSMRATDTVRNDGAPGELEHQIASLLNNWKYEL